MSPRKDPPWWARRDLPPAMRAFVWRGHGRTNVDVDVSQLRELVDHDETREVIAHLRTCGDRTSELFSTAVSYDSLRAMMRSGETQRSPAGAGQVAFGSTGASPEQPGLLVSKAGPLAEPLRRRRGGRADRGGGHGRDRGREPLDDATPGGHGHPEPPRRSGAGLRPGDGPRGQPIARDDVVTKDSSPAPASDYYEVWLFHPATNTMLSVGLLSPSAVGPTRWPARTWRSTRTSTSACG